MEQNDSLTLSELVKKIYIAIRKNLILIAVIIVVVTGAGYVYSVVSDPVYQASENAVYHANTSDNVTTVTDSRITEDYFDTVMDFCKKSCVTDRANYYYEYYDLHRADYQSLSEYVLAVRAAEPDSELYYTVAKRVESRHIKALDISIFTTKTTDAKSYAFTIKISDASYNAAVEKVKLLVLAVDIEANVKNEAGENKYFGVSVYVEDMGLIGVSSDLSTSRVIIIAFAISLVLAAAIVYLVEFFNRTVKGKNELARLTGTDVLACICEQDL